MKSLAMLLGLVCGTVAGHAAAQQASTLPPDVHIIRVWDCSVNHVSKGWAINEHDCHTGSVSARQALDRFLKDNADFKDFQVVGVETKDVKRGGIVRSKVWKVYDYQLRPPAKPSN